MGELGPWLVRAREARGLTLEDAERDTRISRRYLQALEDEQFDVIPAPVYARGFLRSYSQYLGLDPQEAMARYPRDEEAYASQATARRPVREAASGGATPRRSQAPNRPTWRRPTPIRPDGGGAAPARHDSADDWEPTIGIDIGVPVPTRRLDRDPAAQTRTMAVVIVAVAAVLLVILLAFLVSRAGGGDDGGIVPDTSGLGTENEGDGAEPTPTSDTTTSAQPGIVPEVEGLTQEQAIAEIRAAGFEPNVRTAPDNAPAGTVVTQSPGPGVGRDAGTPVTILVSEGPSE